MKSFGVEHPVIAAGKSAAEIDTGPTVIGMQSLGGAGYSCLAEECYFLAAIARDPEAASELIEKGDEYLRFAALDCVVRREEAQMAVIGKDNDRNLRRMVADIVHWQETFDRLVELRRPTSLSDTDVSTVTKQDWQQLAENARRHAAEHTDLDTKQALLELADSYDKLAQRDADRAAP
jgi:hypothetical protein